MDIIYSASMGTASMVLATLLIYLCFAFIFLGNFQLIASSKNGFRTHMDAFGFSIREMEIFSFTTFMNVLVCLILQPVIYIVMFTSYDLGLIAYIKFIILLSAIVVLERLFFLDMVIKKRQKLQPETLFIHTIALGIAITMLVSGYFKAIGA